MVVVVVVVAVTTAEVILLVVKTADVGLLVVVVVVGSDVQHLATRGAAPFSTLEHAPKLPSWLGLTHAVLAILAALSSSFKEAQEVSNTGTAVKQAQSGLLRQACSKES